MNEQARRFLRWPANFLRGLFLFFFMLVVGTIYGIGRAGIWLFLRDAKRNRAALARWRGKVMRRSMVLLGATFIKMGQVLSSRPDLLEPETIDELRVLQDRLPAFSFARAKAIIESDFGKPLGDVFAEFDEAAVAAASVAQVHRARLKNGDEVAVKVLRPNIVRQVERDATILLMFARVLALSPKARLSDPVGHLRHFVDAIIAQTDLRTEADNYERFAINFAGSADIEFPAIFREWSTARVLTMQFMRGNRFDNRDRSGDKVLAAVVRQMMFKMCFDHGFVHADLHPGNFLVRDGGGLVVFDAGMAKLLSPDVLLQFIDLARCLTGGTAEDLIGHLRRFHNYVGEIDWESVRGDVTPLISRFRAQRASHLDYSELFANIFAIARTYRIRPVIDLTLVMVAMVTSQGIGQALDPDSDVFGEVAGYLMPLVMKKGLMAQLIAMTPPATVANTATTL